MSMLSAMRRAVEALRPFSVAAVPNPTAEPERILIVDDDIIVLRQAERIIRSAGHVPISIGSPQAALQMARSMGPSVIFLDVLMPGFDGWDVLAALKADPQTSDIPVVMICMLSEHSQAIAAGASGSVMKPLETNAFIYELNRILARRAGTLAASA